MDILIIEDNPQVAGLLKTMTEKWGHTNHVAITGEAALEQVKTKAFDLILMDVFLPDTVAYELIPRIRQHSTTPRIISMTGNSSPDVEQKVRSQGILYYMVKPVDPAELRSILEHLDQKQTNKNNGR